MIRRLCLIALLLLLGAVQAPAQLLLFANGGGQTAPPPPPGATTGLLGTSASIADGSGNNWTVSGTGCTLQNLTPCVVYENGSAAGYTSGVQLLVYTTGSGICQENFQQLWWCWSGSAWTTASGPPIGWNGITNIALSSYTFTAPLTGNLGTITVTTSISTYTGSAALSASGNCAGRGGGNGSFSVSGSAPTFTVAGSGSPGAGTYAICLGYTEAGLANSGAVTAWTITGTNAATVYYISPSGSDSNNCLTTGTACATPNGVVTQVSGLVCGNIIQAATGTYTWSAISNTPTCAGKNNVVMIECATAFACTSSGNISIGASYWGLDGWVITNASPNACYLIVPATTSTTIGSDAIVNSICNGAQYAGINGYFNSPARYGNLAIIGNIVYNAAQTTSLCGSGITIVQPGAFLSSGDEIYVAWNYSYGNKTAGSSCNGGGDSDQSGIAFDTWGSYTGIGVAENNWAIGNGGPGFEAVLGTGSLNPDLELWRYNTAAANITFSNLVWSSAAEFEMTQPGSGSANLQIYGNLASGNSSIGAYGTPTGMYTTPNNNSVLWDNNWFYQSFNGNGDLYWGSTTTIYSCQTPHPNVGPFSSVPAANVGCAGNSFTANPSLASLTVPGAPSCGGKSDTLTCFATQIANLKSSASGSAGFGAQQAAPADGYNTTPFVCNVLSFLPATMFQSGGGPIPNRCSASLTFAADNATSNGTTLTDTITSLAFPFAITMGGGVSEPERAILWNTTGSLVSLGSPYYTGPFTTAATNCTSSLAAGAQCYIWINYTPTATGTQTGSLSFGGGAILALSGTGQSGSIVSATCSTFSGNPTLAANTTYVLGDTTCSGVQFHTSSGTVIQGDCTAPEGTGTIFNGNSTTGVLTDGGYGDLTSNVTLRCITVENYGYTGSVCHSTTSGSPNSTPMIYTWTGWLLDSDTFRDSCGVGLHTVSTSRLHNSLVTANAYNGAVIELAHSGGAAGAVEFDGDEFSSNSNYTHSGADCGYVFDCGAFKVYANSGGASVQTFLATGLYSHGNIGPSDEGVGAWGDIGNSNGYSFAVENSTIVDNGGDGVRCEILDATGSSCAIESDVLSGNEIGTYGQAQIAAIDTISANISNNFVGSPGAGAASGQVIVGPDSRGSGITINAALSGNIVQLPTTSFGSGWDYGIGSVDGTSASAGTVTSSSAAFYTGGNSTSEAVFRDAPSSTTNVNVTAFKSALGDSTSTIATGSPTSLPSGCSGDGTFGVGCVGSGM